MISAIVKSGFWKSPNSCWRRLSLVDCPAMFEDLKWGIIVLYLYDMCYISKVYIYIYTNSNDCYYYLLFIFIISYHKFLLIVIYIHLFFCIIFNYFIRSIFLWLVDEPWDFKWMNVYHGVWLGCWENRMGYKEKSYSGDFIWTISQQ